MKRYLTRSRRDVILGDMFVGPWMKVFKACAVAGARPSYAGIGLEGLMEAIDLAVGSDVAEVSGQLTFNRPVFE